MASYVVPQVEIHQLFSEIPVALAQNQVPFIFGPNYLLHRFEDAGERAGTSAGEYLLDANGVVKSFYAYPGAIDPLKVESSKTKLFADNAVVGLFAIGAFDDPYGMDNYGTVSIATVTETVGADPTQVPNKLEIDLPADQAKEVVAGRRLRLTLTPKQGYTGITPPDTVDVKIAYVLEKSSYYLGPDGSGSGTDEEWSKLTVTIDEELNLEAISQVAGAILCEVQYGVEIPRYDVTDTNKQAFFWKEGKSDDDYGIVIDTALKVLVADNDFPEVYGLILSADLYIQYRELINAASDTIHSLKNVSDVATALGAVSPDNPLAQAVYNAVLNAGGQTIRYMAVPTDDEEGYDKVLAAATLTKEVYFLVPVTRDSKILDKVQSHVGAMSAPTTKRWRIAFVSAEIPEKDPIYTPEATTGGRKFQALCTAADDDKKTAEITFVVKNGSSWVYDPDTRFKKDLRVGDTLVFGADEEWDVLVPKEYMITKILSDYKIVVSDPDNELSPAGASTEPTVSEIYHPYTNAEKAEVIRDLSSSFADRRMYNVFPSEFKGGGVLQTGEFAAAAVAGLVSSCLPQQPVTNLELVGIDDIPLTYQTFSYDELNTMASGGTFIVMQDLPNDQVYIRHQISTDYEANNLNTAELSITKNLDSISYYFDNLCSPYIGKYNITPDLLAVLHNVITGGLTSLESTTWGLYGPQIIAEGTEILLLEQDAVLKDHVNCNLKLNLPYPFNHLVLKLFV